MDKRYDASPAPELSSDSCHNDTEFQALDSNSIEQSTPHASPDSPPNTPPIIDGSQNAQGEPVPQKEAADRLKQAARILVNGAIRAAMKMQAAASQEITSKPSKTAAKASQKPMSDIRTSPVFCVEGKENETHKSVKEPSVSAGFAKADPKHVSGSKDLQGQGALLGSMS